MTVERVEENEDGTSRRIESRASPAKIDFGGFSGYRRLAIRFDFETTIQYGGVRPARPFSAPERAGTVVVAVFPDTSIAGSRQEAFVQAVAERANEAADLESDPVRDAISESIGSLGLERPYVVLCWRDNRGHWESRYYADMAASQVLNPQEICSEILHWVDVN